MKKRTIIIGMFILFLVGVISIIGTYAIDSTITEGNSSTADYLFNITLGDRTNREVVIPSYDSKIVDIKISNPNEFNMSYLLYIEGVNSNISVINIKDTEASGVLASKTVAIIQVFIQNNSSSDVTIKIKDKVGFEKETLTLPDNSTGINKGNYYKVVVKSNNNTYGKVKPNIKLSTSNGTVKYEIVPNTGYTYKSNTCNGTVSSNILTISNITSNINCEVVFEPIEVTVSFDSTNLVTGLNDVGTTTETRMQYSVSNKVVTVTALNDDGYGFTNARVYLEAGKTYIFSCTTNGTWGGLGGEDTVEAFLMLNGATNEYYRMVSNNNYAFTPSTTGEYWLRLDVNKSGETHTFSNISISTIVSTKTVTYGSNYADLPAPTRTGYTFLGWYTEPNGQGTKVTEDTILSNVNAHTLYAHWQINTYTITYDYRNNIYNQDTSTWILSGNNSHVDNTYSYNGTTALYLASSSLYTGVAIPLNGDKKQTTNYKLSMKSYRTIDFSGNLRAYSGTFDSAGNLISWNHGISVNTSNLSLNTWKEYNYSFNTGAYSSWDYIYIDYDTENQGPVYVSDIRLDEYTTGIVTYDTNYTNLPTPTRTGYTFLGWYTGENGTGTKITSESIVSTAGDHTLYAYWQISDTTAPTCTLRASAGSTTITATVSDTGGSGIAGKGFSTSYGGETTKTVSSTGTIKYYVKDGAGNTGTCSATISATTENCDCGAGFPQSGACYIGIIENGKWVGNRYYKECDWTYTCSSGTKLSNSYCFKAN